MSVEVRAEPVFIIGSPRSGTTVLSVALAKHEAFWRAGEIHLTNGLFGNGRLERLLAQELAFPGALRLEGITREEYLEHLGRGLDLLLSTRAGGRRWIDQTPINVLMAGTLADMFPGAKFIHVVRDGRSVVDSMIHFDASQAPAVRRDVKASGFRPPWASSFRVACTTWAQSVDAGQAFARTQPDRCMTVSHGVLSDDPASIGTILAWLGVEPSDGPAAYVRSARINSSFPGDAPRSPEQSWRTWSQARRRLFTALAGPTMVRSGFATNAQLGSLPDFAGRAVRGTDAVLTQANRLRQHVRLRR